MASDIRSRSLREIAPNADPAFCKILDFGSINTKNTRKRTQARKPAKNHRVKESNCDRRPRIDDHDSDVKMRIRSNSSRTGQMSRDHAVACGRELASTDLGMASWCGSRDDLKSPPRSSRCRGWKGPAANDHGHVAK